MANNYFDQFYRYLVGLGYRMLGSVHDAEEVVQETFLRYQSAGEPELHNAKAWLTRVCTRICMDRMKRLSTKREEYPGQWLPEPFVDPVDQVTIDETLSMALLVGLNALSSQERAVFLLHDIFDYRFAEVAQTLDLSESHCRQLAVRARRKLRHARSSSGHPAIGEPTRITTTFLNAVRDGDTEALEQVLAEDVQLKSDGGGKVDAVPYPLVGRHKVLTFLIRALHPLRRAGLMRFSDHWFNGAPGFVIQAEGHPPSAFHLQVEAEKVTSIFVQRNPDKLQRLLT